MKSPMFLGNTFFFLFVLLATTLPSTRAEINLFDDSGEPVRNGRTFYMLPVANGKGGGPTVRKTGNDKCPLTILQDSSSSSSGLPVRISNTYDGYYVQEFDTVSIQFVGKNVPSCAAPSSGNWGRVDKNLKLVNNRQYFKFKKYHLTPDKPYYVITDCYDYVIYTHCSRVLSVNGTFVLSNKGDKPWVFKLRRTYVNSDRDSWSIV